MNTQECIFDKKVLQMQEDKLKALALDKLHNQFGIKGDLFGFQEECILRIVKDRLDTFCIRKTGAGKSLCYQIPATRCTEGIRTKYCFNDTAMNYLPDAFPLHEPALQKGHICNIPNGVLGIMSDFSDNVQNKKKLDEDADVTTVKYYLLRELNRIFLYYLFHDIRNMEQGWYYNEYSVYKKIREKTFLTSP